MKEYDYIIVGAGLFGAVFAHEMNSRGKRCLVLEQREHIGGNCYTRRMGGINVHWYGAHIFHTDNETAWNYIRRFCKLNHYVNSPIASFKGELYNLPFNMNTFCRLWSDVHTPDEAKRRIEEQRGEYAGIEHPANLKEQGLKLVGKDIYEKLIEGYSEKQWGRPAEEIPAFVLRRVPLRFTFDNNYFNDPYQGIPEGGYTNFFEQLLEGVEVRLGVDFYDNRNDWMSKSKCVLYTGPLDAWFGNNMGRLEWRSLRFEHQLLEKVENFQGNAVFNFTDRETPYTRRIEHKHFEFGKQPDTVVSYEYPEEWHPGALPCYPINDTRNEQLAEAYRQCAASEGNESTRVLFGGRLAEYRYYDMDDTILRALDLANREG